MPFWVTRWACSMIGSSAATGRAHTDFAEAKLQRRLIEGSLEDSEIDALSVVALAGAAAEATQYEEVWCLLYKLEKWACKELAVTALVDVQVTGQTADLIDLQRILMRSKNKLSAQQQQNMTVRTPSHFALSHSSLLHWGI